MFQSKKSHRLMALALSAVVGLTATFAAAETVTPAIPTGSPERMPGITPTI